MHKIECEEGTWIQPEEMCYPSGGMKRKAKARFPDGNLRTVRCGLPDTLFSIPVHRSDGDGFITDEGGVLVFNPHNRRQE